MPYTIEHVDGSKQVGQLDGSGKTGKVENLKPGTATITFGDRKALEKKQQALRTQLKAALDKILAAEKAKVANDQAHQPKHWWGEVYQYSSSAVEHVAEGAWDATKGAGHLIVAMFEGAADALAFTGRVTYDIQTGNIQDLRQIKAEATQRTKVILSKIESGYNLLKQLADDPQTRALLENFAADYYKNMNGLMILNDVSSFVGGLIPAIIVAVLTKNPEALGLAAAGDGAAGMEQAATLIPKIEKVNQEIEQCATIDAAKVDKLHTIDTKVKQRINTLKKQGHGPQRHEGDMTKAQLKARVTQGIDPETGTTTDKYTGRRHNIGQHATKITSEVKYVEAEKNVRGSDIYKKAIENAEDNSLKTIRIRNPIGEILGSKYKDHVFGYTRTGGIGKANTISETDFSDGTIFSYYAKNKQGTWILRSLYPDPK